MPRPFGPFSAHFTTRKTQTKSILTAFEVEGAEVLWWTGVIFVFTVCWPPGEDWGREELDGGQGSRIRG